MFMIVNNKDNASVREIVYVYLCECVYREGINVVVNDDTVLLVIYIPDDHFSRSLSLARSLFLVVDLYFLLQDVE
jgi:hypothetical protein